MEIVDIKDKKILYELDLNSRISYAQLSRKVQLKQETIRYRIQNLIKKNIIFKFQTIIDSSKLGIIYHKIFFKLQANNNTRDEIINYLSNNQRVTWLGKIDGNYDLGINILSENFQVLNDFLSDLFNKFPNNIIEKKISTNLQGKYYNRTYLINKNKTNKKEKNYDNKKTNKNKIDETDFNILSILCQNSRTTTVEIGNKLNISHDTALQRIKKLEKNKIITGYTIVLNNEKIKQLNYKVLIYLRKFSNETISNLSKHLENIKEITYIVKSIGNWDLDFEMEVQNVQQAREILISITDKFSEIINKYELLLIYEFTKYDFLPLNYKFSDYISKL